MDQQAEMNNEHAESDVGYFDMYFKRQCC